LTIGENLAKIEDSSANGRRLLENGEDMGFAAIFESGARQYAVGLGDVVRVERLDGAAGDRIEFNQVLLLRKGEATTTGRPFVDGARIVGEIVKQGRDDRLVVFKHKKRQVYRRKNGHRQQHTLVRITDIVS
jgi:large subunit ribosomal protein L21